MTIIVLKGEKQKGKTPTLKMLHETLIKAGAIDIAKVFKCLKSQNDIECFMLYKGLKIAIVTMGDYCWDICRHIGYYDAKGADILVVAENLNCANVEKEIISSYGYGNIYIDKGIADVDAGKNAANQNDCNKILQEIENVIAS